MRQNKMLLPTLREVPKDAEIVSHRLLLRAGLARMFAAGMYTYLPLGLRVLRKIEHIVREEMDKSGAQEILGSILQPAELWHTTGRWDDYGPEMMKMKDRHDRDFVLGPTHEELVTTLAKQEVNSYKRLPFNIYQVATKFRDERRPRFGMLRAREFTMKDAYSFHASYESLGETYDLMHKTYTSIFTRLGLNFRPVQADAGTIGGSGRNHEFMVLADIGEDTIAVCTHCDYAANLEKAEARYAAAGVAPTEDAPAYEKLHTPEIKTIDQLVESLNVEANTVIKTLVYLADGEAVAVVLRGDHEVNELKLQKFLGARTLELASHAEIERVTGVPSGFVGPVGLKIPVVIDRDVLGVSAGVAGANERDYHFQNVVAGRDFQTERVGDLRNAVVGDLCPHCEEGTLEFYRGIEVGHIFELGTKYSDSLGATFLNQDGKAQSFIMGCYGIGISRLITAVIEQNNDEKGIIWPMAVAPYQVHVIPVKVKDEEQMRLAEQLYNRLREQGVDVLLDDRDESAGVKFKDSDLIGLPVRVTVGKKAGEGIVEFTVRKTGEAKEVSLEQAYEEIMGLVAGH
ncbi:proline--tRNA ligase [Tumebacillus sp. DT12]|uniref:Proline--tRNA ligase n=1 Tax=Tumebacillus lacus TaxID=2995335 RepID=A0ABT3WZ46_9BACL|nr:proline--tRNA ligase [Tumebacillus lacus]MCX7568555.1 proline--tRNA ligase [Tumebacillus lacus]